jgi:transcriptional regulator with XRE-family HTH domain
MTREQWPAEFAALMEATRKSRRLTQVELGERMRRNHSVISRWESGYQRPTLAALFDLATALEVSPAALLPAARTEPRSRLKSSGRSSASRAGCLPRRGRDERQTMRQHTTRGRSALAPQGLRPADRPDLARTAQRQRGANRLGREARIPVRWRAPKRSPRAEQVSVVPY